MGHDFALLHLLQVLLDQRGVSRAAEQLGISQPAMSRVLARLRDLFQDPLLIRSGAGMVLTPRAEALRGPLMQWLTDGAALLQAPKFDPAKARKVFRVASSDFGVLSVVTPVIARLGLEAPDCTLAIEPLSNESLRRLAAGELDIVITGYSPVGPGLKSRRLFRDGYLGLASPDHPVHDAPPSKSDLLEWPHVVTKVGQGLVAGIVEAFPELEGGKGLLHSNSFSLTPYMVAASRAVALLPARAARRFAQTHGLKTFPLPDDLDIDRLDYFLVWHERARTDAAAQWLIALFSTERAAN